MTPEQYRYAVELEALFLPLRQHLVGQGDTPGIELLWAAINTLIVEHQRVPPYRPNNELIGHIEAGLRYE